MAAISPAILQAIGFTLAPRGYVEVPEYIRYQMCDTWDGAKLEQIIYSRKISLSLLCGIVLQSDPDRLRQ